MARDNKVEIEIILKGTKATKDIKAFTSDASSRLKQIKAGADHANKGLGEMGKNVDGLRRGFVNFKTVGVAAFVAVAAAITAAAYAAQRIGRDAIKAASDLEEVQNKFGVVFSDQIVQAEEWADTLRESYIMSRREARQYLSSIQDLLVPMGMASKEAGKLSFEIVKLSADLGSFNNLPTAQVMGDIQSALVGNYETMKKYGVVLTAATVEERALAMGLAQTKDGLTAAHKARAAYTIMVKDSAAAIGDVARSEGSYANQQKQLKANIEDLQATLGNALLPTATKVISTINEWIKANERLIQQKIPEYLKEITGYLEKIAIGAGVTIDVFRGWEMILLGLRGAWLALYNEFSQTIIKLATAVGGEWWGGFYAGILDFDPGEVIRKLEEVNNELDKLKQQKSGMTTVKDLFAGIRKELEDAEKIKLAEEVGKAAGAIKAGAKETGEMGEGLKYVLDGVEKVVGETETTRATFTKIGEASKDLGESFEERTEKLEKQNELLKKQIELLQTAAAAASKPGVKSYIPAEGMRLGGPVLPMQGGGAIPGWGGGDKIPGLLEPGEFVMRKEAVRSLGADFLSVLNRSGGLMGPKEYIVVDFRLGKESFPLQVREEDVTRTFLNALKKSKLTQG